MSNVSKLFLLTVTLMCFFLTNIVNAETRNFLCEKGINFDGGTKYQYEGYINLKEIYTRYLDKDLYDNPKIWEYTGIRYLPSGSPESTKTYPLVYKPTPDSFSFVLLHNKYKRPTSDLYKAENMVIIDFWPGHSGAVSNFSNHSPLLAKHQCIFY